MKQNSSKKPASLRKLSEHEMFGEETYRSQLRSSWALRKGETVVDKAEREAREDAND